MEIEKRQISAVHENDLDNVLEGFGIKDRFDSGTLKCKFCGIGVTKDNLYSILPEGGSFSVVCDKPECISALLEHLEEKRKTKSDLR